MKVYFLLSHLPDGDKAYIEGFSADKRALKRYMKRCRTDSSATEMAITMIRMSESAYDELVESQQYPMVYCPFGYTAATEEEVDSFVYHLNTQIRFLFHQLYSFEIRYKRYTRPEYIHRILDGIYIALEHLNNLMDLELDINHSEEDGWNEDKLFQFMLEREDDYPF